MTEELQLGQDRTAVGREAGGAVISMDPAKAGNEVYTPNSPWVGMSMEDKVELYSLLSDI